jgi:hypothetical protein
MNKSELLEKIELYKKKIAMEDHKIKMCYEAIAIDPRDALSVFVIDMEKRKARYEMSLKNLEDLLGSVS